MSFTNFLNTKLLNHAFRGESFTAPTSHYAALFTSTNIEVTGGGYERQLVTFGEPVASGTSSSISNDVEVRFPIAISDWGEVKQIAIFDAETGGNKLDQTELAIPRVVGENDQIIFAEGNITIKLQ